MGNLLTVSPWIIVLILLWSLPWKGVALWVSARKGHLVWFTALLILNTLAILDILYIFIFSKCGEHKNNGAQASVSKPNESLPKSDVKPMIV
jgi:hypothetical protein